MEHPLQPESQPRVRDPSPQPPRIPANFTTQPESWEDDLIAFLRGCKAGTKSDIERERAQGFADKLDMVRYLVDHLCRTH